MELSHALKIHRNPPGPYQFQTLANQKHRKLLRTLVINLRMRKDISPPRLSGITSSELRKEATLRRTVIPCSIKGPYLIHGCRATRHKARPDTIDHLAGDPELCPGSIR